MEADKSNKIREDGDLEGHSESDGSKESDLEVEDGDEGKAKDTSKAKKEQHKRSKKLNHVLCDLFSAVIDTNKEAGNIVVSPFNLYMTLAMIAEGVSGKCLAELSTELKFGKDGLVQKGMLDLLKSIKSNAFQNIAMKTDNWLVTNRNIDISDAFSKLIDDKYGFTTSSTDLSDPVSIKAIDDRIRDMTNQQVIDGLNMISPEAFSMLVITAYFKGEWKESFETQITQKRVFTNSAGQEIEIDMMQNINMHAGKMSNSHFDYLSIPYKNESMVFVIEMSKDGKLSHKPDHKDIIKVALSDRSLTNVIIPKFKVHFSGKIKEAIKKAGIKKIFMPSKSFEAMSSHQMNVTGVIHNSFIDIDETGFSTSNDPTEEGGQPEGFVMFQMEGMDFGTGAQAAEKSFEANKPFFFHVVDTEKEIILFSGRFSEAPANN